MARLHLNINEVEELVSVLSQHMLDVSFIRTITLKYLLEDFCEKMHYDSFGDLLRAICESKKAVKELGRYLRPRKTELFRSSGSWRVLFNNVIPSIIKDKGVCSILIVGYQDASELVSLCIGLDRKKIRDLCQIAVVEDADRESFILKYESSNKVFKSSLANFELADIGGDLESFFEIEGPSVSYKCVEKETVNWIPHKIGSGHEVGIFDLVIIKDHLMYLNRSAHEKVLRWISYHLEIDGYLSIGVNDSLSFSSTNAKFKEIDKLSRIYKKVRK